MTSVPQTDSGQRFKATGLQAASSRPDISILVPAKDEAENLPLFMEQASAAFASAPQRYEIIVIDDGSVDDSWNVLQQLASQYPFLRPVRHGVRRGIADALRTGYLHSRGGILVFYPADLQYKPEDIPRLVAPIIADESDIVAGYKDGKYEKAFVSGIYNSLSRSLFKVTVRDLNSVKAYRREVMDALPNRPDWHRYMVVMAAAQGFKVSEVRVPLYPRNAGQSKFGIGRIPVGLLDMLAVWFELRFARKPLLLFGMMGAGLFIVGVIVGIIAILWRVIGGVGFRPLINLVETCLTVGSVFFATGLIGELIAAQRAELSQLRARLEDISQERDTPSSS
ncbi:MAG TPA: DPM/DPG synthase family glycosyltransferase [Gemmatimonadaceae bacterium]|nr:DPM/DPG synthase family glycosyltransferase [Gemmatimonadaceae bacterium]